MATTTITLQSGHVVEIDGRTLSVGSSYAKVAGSNLIRLTGNTVLAPITGEEAAAISAARNATAAPAAVITSVAAKFAGTCKRSGRRYTKGAQIEMTSYGWALVGADLDLTYQMDRADSAF